MLEIAKILGGLVLDFFKSKREEKQAQHKRKLEIIANKATWEQTAQDNAGSSWKDEYLTLLLSAPAIGAFIPGLVDDIHAGFTALEAMPDWYKASFLTAVAASFGYRSILDYTNKKAKKS